MNMIGTAVTDINSTPNGEPDDEAGPGFKPPGSFEPMPLPQAAEPAGTVPPAAFAAMPLGAEPIGAAAAPGMGGTADGTRVSRWKAAGILVKIAAAVWLLLCILSSHGLGSLVFNAVIGGGPMAFLFLTQTSFNAAAKAQQQAMFQSGVDAADGLARKAGFDGVPKIVAAISAAMAKTPLG